MVFSVLSGKCWDGTVKQTQIDSIYIVVVIIHIIFFGADILDQSIIWSN